MAFDSGLPSITYGLLWGMVAFDFGQLGFPGSGYLKLQPTTGAPNDDINTGILQSCCKARDKRNSRNHGFGLSSEPQLEVKHLHTFHICTEPLLHSRRPLNPPETAARLLDRQVPLQEFGGREWNIGDPETQKRWLLSSMLFFLCVFLCCFGFWSPITLPLRPRSM